jgi:hypothetical protein
MRRWGVAALVAVIAAAPVALPFTVGTAQAQQESWAYNETKKIVNAGKPAETYDANVKVSDTANLFDRQQVEVELDNFKLTHNGNNIGANGIRKEYPVLVMQCRGADPTPETCANDQRSVYYPGHDAGAAQDLRDRAARMPQGPGDVSGVPGAPGNEQRTNAIKNEQLPFVAADGTHYLWRDGLYKENTSDPLINEPTLKSFAPQDTSDAGVNVLSTRTITIKKDAGSDKGVSGKFLFEVRERVTQPSLGCTDTVACSIVVVPIMDMVCAAGMPATVHNVDCGKGAKGYAPGQVGTGPDVINPFLSKMTWFADSNWRNRFVVPIRFAPDPEFCGSNDPRPRATIYGSELAHVAQQRWGSAYCAGVRQTDYLPEYRKGPEYDARRQFTTKLGEDYEQNAILTTQPVVDAPRPTVHAPSALTGFAVAFTIDDGHGEQVEQLTLSPRLLAKLMTQSYSPNKIANKNGKTRYTGSSAELAAINSAGNANAYYWDHPAIYQNPRSIFDDQEFLALNPDLRMRYPDGGLPGQFSVYFTPVIFQAQSDIMLYLTRYIAADPAAREWLDGKPDEQGMIVNPVWEGMQEYALHTLLDEVVRPPAPPKPVPEWQELTPVNHNLPGAGDECDRWTGTQLLTRLANITSSAEASARALLDRRGSATPVCTDTVVDVPPNQQPSSVPPGHSKTQNVEYSETKAAPAEFGARAMISFTTVAYAELYKLPTAKLVNAGGHAVAPEPGTMVNSLTAAVQDRTTGTVELDYSRLTGEAAYPGTMIAFTAAPTSGLPLDVADNYADFIEFMATDGQTPGDAITNLPPGYDPLTPNLRQQALDAARAVREQKGEVPPIPEGGPLGGGFGAGDGSLPFNDSAATNNGTGAPGDAVNPQGASDDKAGKDDPRNVAQTKGSGSWLSRWALPLLLALGVLAAIAAFVVSAASQPDHPARRLLRTVLRR